LSTSDEQMVQADKVLDALEANGWGRDELPGPGDLADAIEGAGLKLVPAN
jgi:hypothetical protein